MGFGEGEFAWVFDSLKFFFYLFLHAIMQVQDLQQSPSLSSHETEITDLKLTSTKNGERSSKSNIINSFSCTVCRHYAIKTPHSRVNNFELSWKVFWRRSHTGKLYFYNVYMYRNHIWCEEMYFQYRQINQGSCCSFYGSFNRSRGGRKKWMDIVHVLEIPEQNGKGSFTTTAPHLNIRIKSDFAAIFT